MSITIHQAIERISLSLFNSKVLHEKAIKRGFVEAAEEHKRYMEAEQMAIDALREKAEREDPKPLTIEDLRKMDGEPVWLNVASGVYGLVDSPDGIVWLDRGGCICISNLEGKAYRHKPKEE